MQTKFKVMVRYANNFLTAILRNAILMFIGSSLEGLQMNLLAILRNKI